MNESRLWELNLFPNYCDWMHAKAFVYWGQMSKSYLGFASILFESIEEAEDYVNLYNAMVDKQEQLSEDMIALQRAHVHIIK